MKVWLGQNTSDMNARQLCIKIPKKRIKIKRLSINCSYIWHVDIAKYVYQLEIQSEKVW